MNHHPIDPFVLSDFFSNPRAEAPRERRARKRATRFDVLFEESKRLGAYLERSTGSGWRYELDLSIVEGGVACCATLDDVEAELRDLARQRGLS